MADGQGRDEYGCHRVGMERGLENRRRDSVGSALETLDPTSRRQLTQQGAHPLRRQLQRGGRGLRFFDGEATGRGQIDNYALYQTLGGEISRWFSENVSGSKMDG